jgi:hypothetical protein
MTNPQKSYTDDPSQIDADGATVAVRVPSYRSVLQEPLASLAGNLNDRPDVATAAILGYN